MMIPRISGYTPASYTPPTRQVMSAQNFGRKSDGSSKRIEATFTTNDLKAIESDIQKYGGMYAFHKKYTGHDHPAVEEMKQMYELLKEIKRTVEAKGSCTVTQEFIQKIKDRFPLTYDI